ncbi:putative leucine-rich repeat receptor-like serine/threonine-protein kinase [Abeliophyllum distichum]|uniref:non-specific serine/threonine protein kinase n=1 Tax=Abeliophyllum distichum TaxID=126358 RepID=A0ABD1PE62_9LAMI
MDICGDLHRPNFSSMSFKITMLVLLIQHSVTLSSHHLYPHHNLNTDKAALLEFKKTILSDPNSRLVNWDDKTHVCNFTGVKCGKLGHRVVQINLNDSNLIGLLSPVISNLTQLRVLELVKNQFFGVIPSEFSSLRNLIKLKLSGNNLHGQIPYSLSLLSHLTVIFLNKNNLNGTIPPALFSNCTFLHNVDFSENFLTGKIPSEIGKCPNLWNLNLYSNQLIGEIPASLANASDMWNLDVENNRLSGELPWGILSKLNQMVYLHLSYNHMVSHDNNTNLEPFFTALANCSYLMELELVAMGLGGTLPSSIGRIGISLDQLSLQENQITGSIPPDVRNLSIITVLNLTSNRLSGTIPAEIGELSHLVQLSLSYNIFTDEIPASLGHIPNLGLMDLSNNRLSGQIPEDFGNLVRINSLFLNNNLLSGKIPVTLGRCMSLYKLDLSYNKLTGNIPPEISGMREIRIFLNLSHNHLEGSLPIELSKLESVQEIDFSSNNLNGSIFYQISSCVELRMINFSNNSLQGHLPESLGDLKNLEAFDVSINKLSGIIPVSLNKSHILKFLNLSFNNFAGMIPTGGVFRFHHKFIILGQAAALWVCSWHTSFLSTICCVIGRQRLKVIVSTSPTGKERKLPQELTHNFPRITYKELSEATGGFDDQRLIGSGSYGRVYKGALPDGTQIAVKVLHLQTGNSTKSFNRECQVLKRIRHRNLIRIITACSLPDFKALVLPYMANGSLDSRLYPHAENGLRLRSSDLSLIQRVNICSDIAEGMAYLHHHSPVKVIHCDLKPSNVLLNDDMTALVSDFGIARLVMTVGGGNGGIIDNMGNSTANMLCGSIGYIAPEYGFGSSTSTKGDVYSFGVLVLEMVTRKRPTDDMFAEGLNLHRYVKGQYHWQIENVVDSSLLRSLRDQSPEVKKMWEVAIGQLTELGILCTQESASTRPTMLDCADDLDRLKRYLSGDTTATLATSLGISSSTFSDD